MWRRVRVVIKNSRYKTLTTENRMTDAFTAQMCRYRDAINSACLQGTPFEFSEDTRLLDWAYFYPHPVFFLLLNDDSPEGTPYDVSDIYSHLEKAGYHVYDCTPGTVDSVLEAVLGNKPPTSMLYIDSPVQRIAEAASQCLIDRSTDKDFGMHYGWKCGKMFYRFREPVPYKYRGSSFSSSNVEHVVSYMSGIIFNRVIRPEKIPVDAGEAFLMTLKEKMKKTFGPGPEGKNFVEKHGTNSGFHAIVSRKECIEAFYRENPVPPGIRLVTMYEAIREYMRKLGCTCHNNAEGKGKLGKRSLSVKYFVYRIPTQQPGFLKVKPVKAVKAVEAHEEKKVTLIRTPDCSPVPSPVPSPVRND